MKRVLLLLVLISSLVCAGVGGVFADWIDEDVGEFCFSAKIWETHEDLDGTIGWWKNNGCEKLGEETVEELLAGINANSCWFQSPNTTAPTTCTGMENWIKEYGGSSAYNKFRIQYMAQLLNQYSDRQSPGSIHNVTSRDPGNYLGLIDPYHAYGWEIVDAIEAKCGTSPTDAQFDIMQKVCEGLNSLSI